jgi:hypothetical protein
MKQLFFLCIDDPTNFRFWLSQGAHTAWDSGANLEILLIAGTF